MVDYCIFYKIDSILFFTHDYEVLKLNCVLLIRIIPAMKDKKFRVEKDSMGEMQVDRKSVV